MNLKLKALNLTKKRLIVFFKAFGCFFKKILKNPFLCDIIPMFK